MIQQFPEAEKFIETLNGYSVPFAELSIRVISGSDLLEVRLTSHAVNSWGNHWVTQKVLARWDFPRHVTQEKYAEHLFRELAQNMVDDMIIEIIKVDKDEH